MLKLSSPQLTQETILRWKKESKVAFVPTMGCLHEGHLTLVEEAKKLANRVVVSIFVNPLQFGPQEDFDKYPRTLAADVSKLEALEVDLLFNPSVQEMYSSDHSCSIIHKNLTKHLCGKFRPGHFEGVATVCLKLFQIAQPDVAIFGQKDFQQFRVLKQMVADFNLPLTVVGAETIRETDGLAMSSRNTYLSPEERAVASSLYASMQKLKHMGTNISVGELKSVFHSNLKPGFKLDYAEITSEKDLIPLPDSTLLNQVELPRFFVAAFLGKTRLIDNLALGEF